MTTRFYDPADPTPAALTILGATVLAGTLGYLLFVPLPTTKGIVAKARTKEREIQNRIDGTKTRQREIDAVLAQRKSILGPDSIGPDALARVTRLAQSNGLRLTGFRPQRATDSPTGVTIFPYTLTVEGTFPNSAKFVRAIESGTKDIAVTSFAITAGDAESSGTTSSIGVALFADTPKRPSATPAPVSGATTGPRTATNGASNG